MLSLTARLRWSWMFSGLFFPSQCKQKAVAIFPVDNRSFGLKDKVLKQLLNQSPLCPQAFYNYSSWIYKTISRAFLIIWRWNNLLLQDRSSWFPTVGHKQFSVGRGRWQKIENLNFYCKSSKLPLKIRNKSRTGCMCSLNHK